MRLTRLAALGVLLLPVVGRADDGLDYFEANIRPLFADHCVGCHGEKRQKGGLRLDTKAGWEKGGDSGPALVPGKPDQSRIVKAVKAKPDDPLKMPPDKPLPDGAVAALTKWVQMGAPDPRTGGAAATARGGIDWKAAADFWAFKPVEAPKPPADDRFVQPIDRFIAAKLDAAKLTPSGRADRRTLIRRVTFDLTGLPPTPAEVGAFVTDESEDAYEKVVARLLASPRYGEREGRAWLDLARYAEDQAHNATGTAMPHAWRYRDWVIGAFNRDLPYDRFVKLQLAADLIDGADADPADRRALGFLGLGANYYKNTDIPRVLAEEWDDRVDTLTRTFLGLTVSCARCHDHKFDPIPTADYYALTGVIANSRDALVPVAPRAEVAAYDAAVAARAAAAQSANAKYQSGADRVAGPTAVRLAEITLAVWAYRAAALDTPDLKPDDAATHVGMTAKAFTAFEAYLKQDRGQNHSLAKWKSLLPTKDGPREPPPAVRDLAALFQTKVQEEQAKPVASRNANQQQDLFGDKGVFPVTPKAVTATATDGWKAEYAGLLWRVLVTRAGVPRVPIQAHGVTEPKAGQEKDLKVFVRGNPHNPGEPAPRRFLRVLAGADAPKYTTGSGRKELAEAVADPANPLTARVMVNRLWQRHFGRGIVGTPSNFGTLGERPTHPELLDHLASQFVRGGWSVKKLHREILLSETYQRASTADAKTIAADPENRLLARAPRRRLTAEEFRDATLTAAGTLDLTAGGPSLDLDDPSNHRRTVYGKVSRHKLNDFLRLFDFPDPNLTSERRNETTLPQQQLMVLNGPFVTARAQSLAARVAKEPTAAARVKLVYALAYARPPADDELAAAVRFLGATDPPNTKATLTRLERFAQAVLVSNEFYFLD